MKVRFELPLNSYPAGQADLALLTLGRLVKSGLLPASSKAVDPVAPKVLERFTALNPGKPAPRDLGELLLAYTGDSDADQQLDVDLTSLAATGAIALDVKALEASASVQFTADEFVTLRAGHAGLAPAGDPVITQASLYDEVETAAPAAEGLVTYLRTQGRSQLTFATPLAVTAGGDIAKGAGATEDRHFENAAMELQQSGLVLSLWGTSGQATFIVSPSGRIKEYDATTGLTKPGGTEAPKAKWLLDALLKTVTEAGTDESFAKVISTLAQTDALRARTTPPVDLAERAVWAGGRLSADELQGRVTTLTNTWGVRPLRWQGWIDDPSEVNTARAILEATGGQTAIRPSFLYTIAIGEGLLYYLDANNRFTHVDTSQPVSGFVELGVDTFATSAAGLKKSGLLPAWFKEGVDYTVTESVNEKNENVKSADFPDLRRGLIALRAMLGDSRARFLSDAKTVLGPAKAAKLTQDQIDYFTYVYFNAGAGFGKKHLVSQGLAAVKKWEGPPPPDNRIARFNALQRLSTLQLMDSLQLFPAKSPMAAPKS